MTEEQTGLTADQPQAATPEEPNAGTAPPEAVDPAAEPAEASPEGAGYSARRLRELSVTLEKVRIAATALSDTDRAVLRNRVGALLAKL